MIIIGEKINGSIPSMGKAIAERNEEWIKEIAKKQEAAGATYIDVCASVEEEIELDTLKWMIDLVQSVTDLPLAVDSPSPRVLKEAYKFCNKPGIINSVSMEGDKIDILFPEIKDTKWEVIALLCDDTGIPKCAEDRLRVFDKIMKKAKQYGIAPNRIHIDPLIEMLCTSEDGINMNTQVMRTIREQYPDIHITAAVSNISFNLPVRKLLNMGFTVLAMNAGLDSAILDPTNRDMMGLIYAADTNTNVLPSIHVIGSALVVFALFDTKCFKARRFAWMKAGAVLLAILITLATVFVKQHSVLDIYAGLIACIPLYFLIYNKKMRAWTDRTFGKPTAA
mgnify:CR=1 FL=1